MNSSGMADGGIVVPDFLHSDFFNGSPPGASDWITDVEHGSGDAMWDVHCLGGDAPSQERLPAVEPGLCQVPDAGALFYEDELTDVSTESMMTCMHPADLGSGSDQQQLSDDCTAAPSEGNRDQLGPQHDSDNRSTVTCSRAGAPTLQLDYGKVLSAWEAMGGTVAASSAVSISSSITLRLPAAGGSGISSGELPRYNLAAAPSALLLPPLIGCHPSAAAPGVPTIAALTAGCRPLRRASLQSTSHSELAAQPVDDVLLAFGDSDCHPDTDLAEVLLSCSFDSTGFDGHGFEVSSLCSLGSSNMCSELTGGPNSVALMPPISTTLSGNLDSRALSALCLPSLPQSLASIPAKTMECAKSARAACFVRYKEKKQNRKSGKIRYEMRKLNAEKRPRIRGRFVKRDELRRMLEAEAEEASPRSDASAFDCEPVWPYA